MRCGFTYGGCCWRSRGTRTCSSACGRWDRLTEEGLGCVTLPKNGELRARQQQGKLLSVRVPAVLGLPGACPELFGFIPAAVLPLQAFRALHLPDKPSRHQGPPADAIQARRLCQTLPALQTELSGVTQWYEGACKPCSHSDITTAKQTCPERDELSPA